MNNNYNGPVQRTGFNCPNCSGFIETTAINILTASCLICPQCGLRLEIDKANSRKAFDALKKINEAKRNLDEKSRFSR